MCLSPFSLFISHVVFISARNKQRLGKDGREKVKERNKGKINRAKGKGKDRGVPNYMISYHSQLHICPDISFLPLFYQIGDR